jgi:hypothetical protein
MLCEVFGATERGAQQAKKERLFAWCEVWHLSQKVSSSFICVVVFASSHDDDGLYVGKQY